MDKVSKDIRFGLRSWRRRPGLAAIALVTLALGIGVNTAMFSIVNGVLVRALPFRHAERLVLIWGRTPTNPQTVVSFNEFQEFRRDNRTFDEVALWLTQSLNLTGNSEPQRITGSFVSGTFFDVVGLKASIAIETANADLDVLARRLQAAYPDTQKDRTTNLVSLQEMIVGGSRTPLLLLLASVGVVLLIACVNVGNLLMARAVDR